MIRSAQSGRQCCLPARSFSAPRSRNPQGIPRGRSAWWQAPPPAASPTIARAAPPQSRAVPGAGLRGRPGGSAPTRGTGRGRADLVAGRVQMLSVGLGPVQAHLKSGALKALAAASKARLAALPAVPTSAEAGLPGYEMTTWFGIFVPKGTSSGIVRLV